MEGGDADVLAEVLRFVFLDGRGKGGREWRDGG